MTPCANEEEQGAPVKRLCHHFAAALFLWVALLAGPLQAGEGTLILEFASEDAQTVGLATLLSSNLEAAMEDAGSGCSP